MPEGDNVYRAAARLHAALAGKQLVHSDFRTPSLATTDLRGYTVLGARSRGKHLLIDLEAPPSHTPRSLSIHSHLKMEGAWHVHRPGTRWRRPAHTARVVLQTDDAEAVGHDLGILELLTDPDAALSHLGPDLLAPDFDAQEAIARLGSDPDRAIGIALLDQRSMAGVGNVYRSELCFLTGTSPTRRAADTDVAAMVDLSRRVLWANRDRAARTTTGNTAPHARLWVYGRDRKPCRRCGTMIRQTSLGSVADTERVVYLCPRCQC